MFLYLFSLLLVSYIFSMLLLSVYTIISYFVIRLKFNLVQINVVLFLLLIIVLLLILSSLPFIIVVGSLLLLVFGISFSLWGGSFILVIRSLVISSIRSIFLFIFTLMFNIFIYLLRPFTLTLRVLINLSVGHRLILNIAHYTPWLFIVYILELFVYTVQSFVFVTLVLSYLQV